MAKSWVMHSGHFMMQANIDMTAMEGYMQITRAITCAFMQIISENISLSHGIIFQASERFKMSHLKKAVGREHTLRRQFISKNYISTSRDQIKKSKHSTVSRIHQLVISEPVKWSAVPPPLSKADICFTITLRKIFY